MCLKQHKQLWTSGSVLIDLWNLSAEVGFASACRIEVSDCFEAFLLQEQSNALQQLARWQIRLHGGNMYLLVTYRKGINWFSWESLSLERRFWVPVPMSYGHRWLQDKTDMILRVHEKWIIHGVCRMFLKRAGRNENRCKDFFGKGWYRSNLLKDLQ